MVIKKIDKGEKLRTALLELGIGESVQIPYRYYSEPTIRVTKAQVKKETGTDYEIKTNGNVAAVLTRTV